LVEIRIATYEVASRLRPMLERAERTGARVRLVLPTSGDEEIVVALPEGFQLASAQRLDVERLAGVLAMRDVAQPG